jgi:hypothetical protein
MQHPSSHRSQKENSTVEPKPGDLVNVITARPGVPLLAFGYVVKVERRFDQFDYCIYLFHNQREFCFRKQELEIV